MASKSALRKSRLAAAPVLERHEYPRTWKDYIGQEPAKRMLQVAAKSAKLRNEPLDHTLISHGTPGIGKTSLAALISDEVGRNCRVVSGQLDLHAARMLFAEMQDRDVLFYDEVHQVMDGGKKNAEWLLAYLQDGVLMGPLGGEIQPRVTIIAATTDAGRLPESIVSRFPLQPPMQDYTDEEAAKIVVIMAGKTLVGLPKVNAREAAMVASAAHNNPRAIRRLLTVLRDMTITEALPLEKGRYNIDGLLDWQGITHDGLDRVAQRYLEALALEFDGSAGARALEDRLQQPGGLGQVERVLMDKGLVAKTRSGRMLTQAGISRFRDLVG
jgi:holliday junction DNA helicase RuvB